MVLDYYIDYEYMQIEDKGVNVEEEFINKLCKKSGSRVDKRGI